MSPKNCTKNLRNPKQPNARNLSDTSTLSNEVKFLQVLDHRNGRTKKSGVVWYLFEKKIKGFQAYRGNNRSVTIEGQTVLVYSYMNHRNMYRC